MLVSRILLGIACLALLATIAGAWSLQFRLPSTKALHGVVVGVIATLAALVAALMVPAWSN